MAGKIFINYRRGDSPDSTGRLYEHLEREFGRQSLFMDVEGSIRPGDDFAGVLRRQVLQCELLLAVIGPNWLRSFQDRDRTRADYVEFEIATALVCEKHVIPVLVSGASMPDAHFLPTCIGGLSGRHAVGLRPEKFKADLEVLIIAIKERIEQGKSRGKNPKSTLVIPKRTLDGRYYDQLTTEEKRIERHKLVTQSRIERKRKRED